MIRIEGLTAKQKALMEVMWAIDDLDRVESFVRTLPIRDAIDCSSLIKIVMLDTLEEEQGLDAYETMAKTAIDHSRRR